MFGLIFIFCLCLFFPGVSEPLKKMAAVLKESVLLVAAQGPDFQPRENRANPLSIEMYSFTWTE